MMTFDPEQNRVQIDLLTDEERAALEAAKHGWQIFIAGRWEDRPCPKWSKYCAYRAKPAPAPTILVNGIEVPEPVREVLKYGQRYWFVSVTATNLCSDDIWNGAYSDTIVLHRGLIHLTAAAAVAHAKAMLAPSMRGDV